MGTFTHSCMNTHTKTHCEMHLRRTGLCVYIGTFWANQFLYGRYSTLRGRWKIFFLNKMLIKCWNHICVREIRVVLPSPSTLLLNAAIHWFSKACAISSHPSAAGFRHHPLPDCLSSCHNMLLTEWGYLHSFMTLGIIRYCAKSKMGVCMA